MRKSFLLVAALLPIGFGLLLVAGEGEKSSLKCAGKDASKCCAESDGKVVLTAEKAEALAKEIKLESCPGKSGEILASVLPGLKCKDTLAKLTADVKAKECSKEAANLILAAVKQYGACDEKACCDGVKGKAIALNSEKALLIAAQIRSESCPVKSSEILASALPELKCQETLAKLLTEIKAKGCEKEASELILAAQAKLTPKPEAQKKN